MARNNSPEGSPSQEASIGDSPEGEQQEAGRVLENSIQRIREQIRSEAPETNTWIDIAKGTTAKVLVKGGKTALGIGGALWYIVRESLKEIKEDFKEKIVNPLLKKVGFKPLRMNKEEKKEDK